MQNLNISPIVEAVRSFADANASASAAGKTRNASSGLVTSECITLARAMAASGEAITLGDGRGRKARKNPTTNMRLFTAFTDAKIDKGYASKLSMLTCWLARTPALESAIVDAEGLPYGFNKAHAIARDALQPDPTARARAVLDGAVLLLREDMREDIDDPIVEALAALDPATLADAIAGLIESL